MDLTYYSGMQGLRKRSVISLCILAALVAIFCVLAVFQYRWAGTVSGANRERMQAGLRSSLAQIQSGLNRKLLNVSQGLQPRNYPSAGAAAPHYANSYEIWKTASSDSDLVAEVFVFEGSKPSPILLRWNRATGCFEPGGNTPRLRSLATDLAALSALGFGFQEVRSQPFLWNASAEVPVLIAPLSQFSEPGNSKGPHHVATDFLVLELNLDAIRQVVLPELVHRYLDDSGIVDFNVAVLSGRNPQRPIYRSNPDVPAHAFSSSDGTQVLLGRSPESFLAAGAGASFDYWYLAAKHKRGSVDAVIAGVRRRCLAMNFGVLLVLAAGVASIFASALRAERFLQLQMEFVAGVSHELRTPLAVISSAADNLADGVVRSDQKVREYGSLIGNECRRLSGLVEQTLRFAAGRAGHTPQNMQPVDVADLIEHALVGTRAMNYGNGYVLENEVEPGSAIVTADPDLMSECLLNLINNALKYGGEDRWVGLRAKTIQTASRAEVQITVEDRGRGIEERDLPHIFEPFYRGRAARAAQIPGTGLGLSMTHQTIKAMGGRITVESAPGRGSAFTIHMPAWQNSEAEEWLEAEVREPREQYIACRRPGRTAEDAQ